MSETQSNSAKAQTESIMRQAQVFASAWSMVGGPLDNGDKIEIARSEKETLRKMVAAQEAELSTLRARVAELEQSESRLIDKRDEAVNMADKLAYGIAEEFRVDVGEHSSANCPWEEALNVLNGHFVTDSDKDRRIAELEAKAQGVPCPTLQELQDCLRAGGLVTNSDAWTLAEQVRALLAAAPSPAVPAPAGGREAFELAYAAHAIEYAGIDDTQEAVQQRLKESRCDSNSYEHMHDAGAWVGWQLARAALAATPAEAVPAPAKCAGCNGHGMVGGLLPGDGGYDAEECKFCTGTGKEAVPAPDARDAVPLPESKDMQSAPQFLNIHDREIWMHGWNECRATALAAKAKGAQA